MPIYAVQYTYDERTDVRDEVRPEHRAWLRDLADAGGVLGSGPFVDGDPAGALLVLRADDRDLLDELLRQDPFHRHGVVARTDVREWTPIIGPWSRDL
ncbi:YciI family protein [Cellulomonas endophytica]|uniref:YciI family protein n=1 Tax=Cellulomonas endophytica TaxID=2494735 RepID=UPI0010135E80|nr:YciI family protein [Cellulomonas endophytica]